MMRLRCAVFPLFLAMLILTAAGVARAHPILQNPLFIRVTPEKLEVKLYVSLRELIVIQGVPVTVEGTMDPDQTAEGARRHVPYLLDHLFFTADGAALTGTVTSYDPPSTVSTGPEGPDRSHYLYYLEYPLPSPPQKVALRHTMVAEFPTSPGVPWDLSYAYRIGPPSATPALFAEVREFGALPRDVEVNYTTGFAPPAGAVLSAADPEREVSPWQRGLSAGLRAVPLLLLWLGLALNVRSARDGLRLLSVAVGGFAAGVAIHAAGGRLPAFLLTSAGGAGVLLVAVDNIYNIRQAPGPRRLVLAGVFPAVQGLALHAALAGAWPGVLAAVLPGVALFGIVVLGMTGLHRRLRAPERFDPFLQIMSLAIGVAGIVYLLDALDIRPWAL